MDKDKALMIKSEVKEWMKTFATALMLFLIISVFIVNVKVQGLSMEPNYHPNDLLIVYKLAYLKDSPQHEDVIVFKVDFEEKHLIKRVIGTEGDLIKVNNGRVYRNDEILDEIYLPNGMTIGEVEMEVGEGELFVLGDNRSNSLDSRYAEVGLVSKSDVVGKVFVRVFPKPQLIK